MNRPNTPHDEKKSVKLSLHRIELLRATYEKHHNFALVGRIFHVAPSTVKYWVDEDERRKVINRGMKIRKEKLKDPTYRVKIQKMTNSCARDLRSRQPAISQWEKDNSKIYRENNPELVKKWREDSRPKWAEYASRSYYKNRDFLLAKRKVIYHESKANGTNWYYKHRDVILAKMREDYHNGKKEK